MKMLIENFPFFLAKENANFSGDSLLSSHILAVSIVLAIVLIVILIELVKNFGWKESKKLFLPLIFGFVSAIAFLYFTTITVFIILFLFLLILVGVPIYRLTHPDKFSQVKYQPIPLTEEDLPLMEDLKSIYNRVSLAKTNFDEEEIKKLGTEKMYNACLKQWETLKTKNQREVTRDFLISEITLVEKKPIDDKMVLSIKLTANFYDYFVDEKENVVSGSKDKKVERSYLITFLCDFKKSPYCPNCGNTNIEGDTCPNCQQHLPTVYENIKVDVMKKWYPGWSNR